MVQAAIHADILGLTTVPEDLFCAVPINLLRRQSFYQDHP
jgi:hypothetical protein